MEIVKGNQSPLVNQTAKIMTVATITKEKVSFWLDDCQYVKLTHFSPVQRTGITATGNSETQYLLTEDGWVKTLEREHRDPPYSGYISWELLVGDELDPENPPNNGYEHISSWGESWTEDLDLIMGQQGSFFCNDEETTALLNAKYS